MTQQNTWSSVTVVKPKKIWGENDKIYHRILQWDKKSDSRPVEWLPAKGGTLHYHNLPANTDGAGRKSNTTQTVNNRGRLMVYSPLKEKNPDVQVNMGEM